MTFKQKIHKAFENLIIDKLIKQNSIIKDLETSASAETKSTAGDKHETALAMLQIELANELKKREMLNEQKIKLQMIDSSIICKTIKMGSLVKSNSQYYYLSAALGKITIDGFVVFAISEQAPLAKMLFQLALNETGIYNNMEYKVEAIY